MSGWLKSGEDLKKKEFFDTGSSKKRNEFWVKVGIENARNVIFLDDPEIGFAVHGLKIGDDFETITCAGEDCPACAKNYYKTPVMVFTVLDLTPFTDKDNKERKYFKKPFLAKGKATIEKINMRKSENGGSLKGLKIKITRTTDKSAACGDDFVAVGRTDLSKLPVEKAEDLVPFNYEEIYAPLSASQIESKLKYAAPPGGKFKKTATGSRGDLAGDFGAEATGPALGADGSEEIPF